MTNAILKGKPGAGNPYVRFAVGKVAPVKPRRGSLLYKAFVGALAALCGLGLSAADWKSPASGSWTNADNWVDGTLPSSSAWTYITNKTGKASYTVTLEDKAGVTNSTKGLSLQGKTTTTDKNAALTYNATLNVKSDLAVSGSLNLAWGGKMVVSEGGTVRLASGQSYISDLSHVYVQGGSLSTENAFTGLTVSSTAWQDPAELSISSGTVNLKSTDSSTETLLKISNYGQLVMTGGKLTLTAPAANKSACFTASYNNTPLLTLSGNAEFYVPRGNFMLSGGQVKISDNAKLTGLDSSGSATFSLMPYYSGSDTKTDVTLSGNSSVSASGYRYCEVGKSDARTTGTTVNLDVTGGNHSFGNQCSFGSGSGIYTADLSGGRVTYGGYGLRIGTMPILPVQEAADRHFCNKTTMKVRDGAVLYVQPGNCQNNSALKDLWGFCIGQGLCYNRSDYMFVGRLEIMDGGVVTNGCSTVKVPIFVGAGYATGVVHQTGGRFDAIEGASGTTWNRTVGSLVLGLYGGYGAYEISGGTAYLNIPAYIGGAPVTLSPNLGGCNRSMTSARLPTNYAGKSVGLLKVSGGTMTITRNVVVGYDGTGTVDLSGNGQLTFGGNLTLTNSAAVAEAAALKFTLTDAAQPKLTIGGAMRVCGGARLVVDATDCHAEGGSQYRLFSSTGASHIFPSSQITLKDDGHGKLKVTSKGIWYIRKRGFVLSLR